MVVGYVCLDVRLENCRIQADEQVKASLENISQSVIRVLAVPLQLEQKIPLGSQNGNLLLGRWPAQCGKVHLTGLY